MDTCPALAPSLSTSALLLFLANSGCRAGQSRAERRCLPLSVASRGRHVPACFPHAPARSRHAPGTRLDLPRRIRHKPPAHYAGPYADRPSFVSTYVGTASWAFPGGEPLLFPAQIHPPGITNAGLGMLAQQCRLSITFGHDLGLPGVNPPTVVPEAVVALWR